MSRLSFGLIIFVFCVLFVSSPLRACAVIRGDTVFFEVVPEKLLDADVIAEVSLLADIDHDAYPPQAVTANIMRLIKTSDSGLRQGGTIAVITDDLQCSNVSHKNGDRGIIIGKMGADNDGRPLLCLYSREGRFLRPPSIEACLPDEVEKTNQTRLAAERGELKAQIDLAAMYVCMQAGRRSGGMRPKL